MDLSVITDSLDQYLEGLWLTLHLVALSCAIGLAAAVPLSVARVSRNPAVYGPVAAYTWFFIYYGLGQFEWMRAQWEAGNPFWLLLREPYFCALLAFALNTCAYTTEIIAGSMRNVPHGEVEAAKAIGMSRFVMLRRILLPAALRRAIPAYSNEVILMLQGSSIASAVTLVDLTGAARNVYSKHFSSPASSTWR